MFRRLQLSLFCPARNGIHEEDPSLRQDADQLCTGGDDRPKAILSIHPKD